ncbi:hypothetical protein GGR56DRAFT_670995 [Xylariaceae sp. FL0804]|nr:hypothetical protein GGR56DRAFT_670995 [Xylariaceae sp. FL0804]
MPTLPDGLLLQGTQSSPRGRSAAASRAFRPGEVIAVFGGQQQQDVIALPDSGCLAVPPPAGGPDSNAAGGSAVAAADEKQQQQPPPLGLRACTGCRAVAYCSVACQRADWGAGHRAECKVFGRVRAAGHDALPTPVRALVQALVRPEVLDACAALEGHVDDFRRSGSGGGSGGWADLELQARAALHYVGAGAGAGPADLASAVEILCKLQVNSFNMLDEDVGQAGLYMDPALAMVNHSCLPNAFVQFVGRRAVLHAYREIKKDEEVEISYIDCNLHRSHRREALETRYRFTCRCPRCEDDLDVYEVCQRHPHLELNGFSLVPDLSRRLGDPPATRRPPNPSLQRVVAELYASCASSLQGLSATQKAKQLRWRWGECAALRAGGMYAAAPVHDLLVEANVYFSERESYACSLAISCFLALNIDPYRAPMPFAPARVKGMLMVAKLLANTAPTDAVSGTNASSGPVMSQISQVLGKMDQATVCQSER